MSSAARSFIDSVLPELKALYKALSLSQWEASINGTPDALERATRANADWMRFLADPKAHAEAKRLHESGLPDPLLAREIKLLYLAFAKEQQDEATLEALARFEGEVLGAFANFRAVVPSGQVLTDNEVDHVLKHSADSDEVRAVWEASKEIGAVVAKPIREMARLRNRSARQQGFRDYFERSLVLSEIEETELFRVFGDLERSSDVPFRRLKAELDSKLAGKFGIAEADLRPWHYGNRWFQEPPKVGGLDTDVYYREKDIVALATRTFEGLGMEVGAILNRSDLYPRDGKDQHAFCTDIDREGDIRTLNNLEPNERWAGTLLHELGHAVYDQYIDRSLPWTVRTPPHMLSTEAIALLMGDLIHDREWLTGVLNVPAAEAGRIADGAREKARWEGLIFTRWVLVMTHFERQFYADPERDLDTLWWDTVERYQLLRRPEGRHAPDWASKIHIGLYPVYYHNYELGHLVRAQLRHVIQSRFGGLVDRAAAGRFLKEQFFAPGAKTDWAEHVRQSTGEPLTPAYFVGELGS